MERAGSTPFGQRLRQLRVAAGLTQQVLAVRSRVSVDAISAYENGRRRRPHPETLSMLASGLGLGTTECALLAASARADGRPRPPHRSGRLPQRAAVFLSHTTDLREYPDGRSFVAAAEAAVIRAGHAVSDMAYFPAHDSQPADYCTTMVTRADVYVGIVGHRYGLPVRDQAPMSHTELEFEVATALGMPRLVFLVRDGATPPADQPEEHRARQAAFRQRLLHGPVTIAWVTTPAELELGLYHALVELWAAEAGGGPPARRAAAPPVALPAPEPSGPPGVARGLRRVPRRVAAHVRQHRRPALAAVLAVLVAGGLWTAPSNFGLVRLIGSQAHLAGEALTMKQQVLAGFHGIVDFESGATGATILRGLTTGALKTDVLDGTSGELRSLKPDELTDLTPLLDRLERDRTFLPGLLDAGRLGTSRQYYIPWLQATYMMVVNKKALQYLPKGADVNDLTYDQLIDWGERMERGEHRQLVGLPAFGGDPTTGNGLLFRFLQGYVYPSFTGKTLVDFRSPEAVTMWETVRRLWSTVNTTSLGYESMQVPLENGDVWIAWDHQARLKDALDANPDQYLVVPAPTGPRGRGYMTAVVGLAIPMGAPNQAGAEALIDWLTRPGQQAAASSGLSFFPTVEHVKLAGPRAAEAAVSQQYLHDPHRIGTMPPAGLGAGSDDFTKVYQDTFDRIVLKGVDIRTVLDEKAGRLQEIVNRAGAPCWAPDPVGDGPCHIE